MPDVTEFASPPRQSVDYRTIEKEQPIGRGGQAAVYRVTLTEESGPNHIALKEPLRSGTLSAEAQKVFLSEVENWELVDRRERHRNRWSDYEHIVGVVSTGDQLPWIAMEYMDGGSVEGLLESNPAGIDVERAIWTAACVARGLEIAHGNGIAHLDLTPGNILLRETGHGMWDVPKIADWGLARLLAQETGTMEALSPQYAAPEQFDPGEYGEPDTVTDIYQLGAVLYAMVTGDPPYTGSRLNVMRSVVDGGSPPSVQTHRSDVPSEVDGLISRALSAEKTDRFANVTEFRKALNDVLATGCSVDGIRPEDRSRPVERPPTETNPTGSTEVAEGGSEATGSRTDTPESTSELAELSRVDGKEIQNLEMNGISTVADLAGADETSLAHELDRSPNAVARWIGEAKAVRGTDTSLTGDEQTTSKTPKKDNNTTDRTTPASETVPYHRLDRITEAEAKALAAVNITDLHDLANVDDIEIGRKLDRSPNAIARWREEAQRVR
ncbi:protein kinase [Halobaculum sp. WSA2]|uniref:Protein kinase n=1 Tax=Halobaculum saliterrae TaxID=2073113 RepID=A0A6B0ST32_9EURY|nr:serine/threonine-protein kinase [Halobaculum saliterrae]MXR40736.1 protein kinase [Halobaculum saliterrae]